MKEDTSHIINIPEMSSRYSQKNFTTSFVSKLGLTVVKADEPGGVGAAFLAAADHDWRGLRAIALLHGNHGNRRLAAPASMGRLSQSMLQWFHTWKYR